MKTEEVKKEYSNEWVLVEVLKEDEIGNPTEVRVLVHSKIKSEIYEAMKNSVDKYTYHFYTGKIPKEGYAVAFMSITTH